MFRVFFGSGVDCPRDSYSKNGANAVIANLDRVAAIRVHTTPIPCPKYRLHRCVAGCSGQATAYLYYLLAHLLEIRVSYRPLLRNRDVTAASVETSVLCIVDRICVDV